MQSKWFSLRERLTQRLQRSPLGARLLRGAFWSLAGSVTSRGLALLSWIAVGRILGKEGFGEVGVIQTTLGLFGTLAGFGMGVTATKYVAEFRHSDPSRAGRIVGLASATTWIASGILAAVVFGLAPWLAASSLAAPRLESALRIGSLLVLFGGVAGAQTGALLGLEAFRSISKVNVITAVLSFPVLLLGAWLAGVEGAVWALVLGSALGCLLNWYAFRVEAKIFGLVVTYVGSLRERSVFWHFNIPSVINGVLYAFGTWACSALLVQQANGYAEMGIYNAGLRMKLLPETLAGMLLAPILPVLSEMFGRRDLAGYTRTLTFAYSVCLLVIVPPSLLQLAVPWLTLMPYGEGYSAGGGTVQWLMVSGLAFALMYPMGQVLISMGRIWFGLQIGVIYVGLQVGLAFWLIPLHGASGLAMAFAVAFVLANIPCVVFLYRHFSGVMADIAWARMTIFTVVAGAACLAASHVLTREMAAVTGVTLALLFAWWIARTSLRFWGAGQTRSDR